MIWLEGSTATLAQTKLPDVPPCLTQGNKTDKNLHLRPVRQLVDKDIGHQVEDLILAPGLMW